MEDQNVDYNIFTKIYLLLNLVYAPLGLIRDSFQLLEMNMYGIVIYQIITGGILWYGIFSIYRKRFIGVRIYFICQIVIFFSAPFIVPDNWVISCLKVVIRVITMFLILCFPNNKKIGWDILLNKETNNKDKDE